MKNPLVLIENRNEGERCELESYLANYPLQLDISSYESYSSLLAKDYRSKNDVQVCLLAYDNKELFKGTANILKKESPHARVILTSFNNKNSPEYKLSLNEHNIHGFFNLNNKYTPPTDKLELFSILNYFEEEGYLYKKLNIAINGLGLFSQSVLNILRSKKWLDNLELYSASVNEIRPNKNKRFSYRGVIRNTGLDEFFQQGRVRCYLNLEDYTKEVSKTSDVAIFCSAKHRTNYQNVNRISNPMKELNLMWGQTSIKTSPGLAMSTTPDGARGKLVMYDILKDNCCPLKPNYPYLAHIEPEDISNVNVYGEHHQVQGDLLNILIRNRYSENKTEKDLGEIISFKNLLNKKTSSFKKDLNYFNVMFKREMQKRAVETMIDAHEYHGGYTEAPQKVVDVLDSIAYRKQQNNKTLTNYFYFAKQEAYLQAPVKRKCLSKPFEFEPIINDIKELPTPIQQKLIEQCTIQKMLVKEFKSGHNFP